MYVYLKQVKKLIILCFSFPVKKNVRTEEFFVKNNKKNVSDLTFLNQFILSKYKKYYAIAFNFIKFVFNLPVVIEYIRVRLK